MPSLNLDVIAMIIDYLDTFDALKLLTVTKDFQLVALRRVLKDAPGCPSTLAKLAACILADPPNRLHLVRKLSIEVLVGDNFTRQWLARQQRYMDKNVTLLTQALYGCHLHP